MRCGGKTNWTTGSLDGKIAVVTGPSCERPAGRWNWGRVDIVFANAGIHAFKPLLGMNDADTASPSTQSSPV